MKRSEKITNSRARILGGFLLLVIGLSWLVTGCNGTVEAPPPPPPPFRHPGNTVVFVTPRTDDLDTLKTSFEQTIMATLANREGVKLRDYPYPGKIEDIRELTYESLADATPFPCRLKVVLNSSEAVDLYEIRERVLEEDEALRGNRKVDEEGLFWRPATHKTVAGIDGYTHTMEIPERDASPSSYEYPLLSKGVKKLELRAVRSNGTTSRMTVELLWDADEASRRKSDHALAEPILEQIYIFQLDPIDTDERAYGQMYHNLTTTTDLQPSRVLSDSPLRTAQFSDLLAITPFFCFIQTGGGAVIIIEVKFPSPARVRSISRPRIRVQYPQAEDPSENNVLDVKGSVAEFQVQHISGDAWQVSPTKIQVAWPKDKPAPDTVFIVVTGSETPEWIPVDLE